MNHGSNRKDKLRSRLRATTRAAILEAAQEVFAEQGFSSARVDDIAAVAGVSVGTLYNYFGDRDGLLNELLQDSQTKVEKIIDQAIHDAGAQSFRGMLEAFLHSILKYCDDNRAFMLLLLEEDPHCLRKKSPGKSILTKLSAHTLQILKKGIQEGLLHEEELDLHSYLLSGLMRATILRALTSPMVIRAEDAVPTLVRLFVNGLKE